MVQFSKLHATTSTPDVYWTKWSNFLAHLDLYLMNPDTLEKVINWVTLSISTEGKYTTMQAVKEPEHGRSWTEE